MHAARRETREETGFDVRIRGVFAAEVYSTISKRGRPRPEVGVYFHCAAPAAKPPALDPGEHTDFAWVRRADLVTYPTLPHLAKTVHAAFATRDAVLGHGRSRSGRSPPVYVDTLALPVPA